MRTDLPRFSSAKLTNRSYYSETEMDNEKKDTCMLKKKLNYRGSILDENCETQLTTLTLAEIKDLFRKYVHALVEFDRINQIKSLKEEICLKEVYLLLLNLKNPDYSRTLSPHNYNKLFDVLGLDLTDE